MAELTVQNVAKKFANSVAVSNVSFKVHSDEFVSLVGPSGCGKTTCLRVIAGFEQADEGTVLVDGRTLDGTPPEKRGIGFVFQNYALFPHMNVGRNIAYGLKFCRSVNTSRRVAELLDLVDLAGYEKRKPDELSSGQRQRVALARALAPNPWLLLLDEPLSALDAKLREELRIQIRRIQQELKVNTVYVTHDQEEALGLSDRVVVMNNGTVEQIGNPAEIYEAPRTGFVASFVGRTNRIEGAVARIDGLRTEVKVDEESFVVQRAAVQPVHVGDRVMLFVRQEDMEMGKDRENTLTTRVIAVEYQGEASVLHLESGVGDLRASVSNSSQRLPKEGEYVMISFLPEKGYLFPAM